MVRLLLGAALTLALTFTLSAGDWPQWRGPGRDNKVADFTIPQTWPKELKQKWKVAVGEGLASPALVGDKLFVFTREGGDEVIRCLDAATGNELWKDKYAADEVKGMAAGKGVDKFTGPRSSPAVGGGKVCTFGVAGVVSCLDAATGKPVWRKDTKARPMFFTSTSPVIADGACIVHTGSSGKGGGKGELTAFDLATGEAKWTCPGEPPAYGSPVVAKICGVKQVVELTDTNLVGVGLADGKLLWKTPLKPGRYQTGTPVIDGDVVICAGTAFTIEKKGDGLTATQLWKGQAPHQYNTPVLKEGLLYGLFGMGDTSRLYCQDAKTGKVLWEDTTARGKCGAVLDAGPVMLALTSDSNLIAFKPGKDDYAELAKIKVADTPTWAMPVVTGTRVFVKDSESVILWVFE
jgi:outer membrane protein assembly factor BamB